MESYLKSLPENFELFEFKLEKVLGQGGFGITYLALDKNLMQHVAIKEYYPREFASRDSTFTIHAVGNTEDRDTFKWGLKRFLDEARVLAQLNHPNVISIKRFFEAHGTAYLVMEYCDGKPLDEIIRDRGPLDEVELNSILFPLLDGLEHVHEKEFLHRDIKPANIFIRRNGTPVLLDFGAAKHEMTTHSKSVTSLATAGYAPFEQYSTKGKQGAWSDIYGLAATIYRAISGVKPQDAPDRMLEDNLIPAVELLKGKFNSNLLMALDKALSIRPNDRPQTITQFRDLIKGDLAGTISKHTEFSEITSQKYLIDDSKTQNNSYSNNAATATAREGQVSPRGGLSDLLIKNRFYMIFLSILFGLGWFFLSLNKSQSTLIDVEILKNDSISTDVKVLPVLISAASVASESSIKTIAPVEDKKPILSFFEIDRAIESGQLGRAQSLIKDVIRSNPESAAAYYRQGQIFAKQDKYSEAREQLNRAKGIDPSLTFTTQNKFKSLYNEVLVMEKMSKLPSRD